MEYFNITIDGPAGAGRNTIAELTAKRLRSAYVDTGAMYHSMALYFIRQDISPEGEEAIAGACGQVKVTIRYTDGVQQVVLSGGNASELIRSEGVGRMVSTTPVYRSVREKLTQLQKQLARKADIIVDSRDIDTCALPDVPARIYLAASVETRARCQFGELEERGTAYDIREIEKDIEERDYQGMRWESSPLRQAENAMPLDSSHMTIGQVVDSIVCIVGERGYEE